MGITSLFPQSIEGWIVFLLLTIGPTIFTTTRLPRDANRKPNPLPALFMLAGTLVFCCTFLGITTYMVRNQNKWYSLIVVIAVIFIGFTVAWKLIQAALVLTGILKAPDDRPLGAILEDDEPEEEDPVPVHTLEEIAQTHDIPQVPPEQPNYHGYKLVLNDLGGQPSPAWSRYHELGLGNARREYRLYGNPGIGLETSNFDSGSIQSGQRGEQLLAKAVANSPDLNVVSFWSLYGMDGHSGKTNADIDCVLIGIGQNGIVRRWFVDAKNYKGGADTRYVNTEPGVIARVSVGQHAFIAGVNGHPDLRVSRNMAHQRAMWSDSLPGMQDEWVVCMTGGQHGTPDVTGLMWPGGIRVVTVEQLLDEIRSYRLAYPANIPVQHLERLKRMLKPSGKR